MDSLLTIGRELSDQDPGHDHGDPNNDAQDAKAPPMTQLDIQLLDHHREH